MVHQYNYFKGKSAQKHEFANQLTPQWCEHIFELEFTQLCRKFPGVWIEVPVGNASNIGAIPSFLQSDVDLKYQQNDKNYCVTYSLASALYYIQEVDAAKQIADSAAALASLPGELVLDEFRQQMLFAFPKNGECQIFNKAKRKKPKHGKRTKEMSVTDLLYPSPYVTLVIPKGVDGSSDHAICVVDDLIFDARYPRALRLNIKSLNSICGNLGLEKLGVVFQFCEPYKVPRDKRPREMVLHDS